MSIREEVLRTNGKHGSGQVRRFILENGKRLLTQITTFCPGGIGPGPTNLYLIEDEALILVDTGMPTNASKILLYTLFGHSIPSDLRYLPNDLSEKELIEGLRVAGYAVEDIDMILISHGHWDHFLLGKKLVSMGKAKVLAHIADTPIISNPWTAGVLSAAAWQQFKGTGMPYSSDLSEFFSGAFMPEDLGFPLQIDKPIFRETLLGDAALKAIQVKHLPGHSPGSIGLLLRHQDEQEILICGDVLLHPITPHPDDLLAYLRTLAYLKTFKSVALVLPAHGDRIESLEERVALLQEHHRRRLRLTYEGCFRQASVWDIATMEGYFDIHVPRARSNVLAVREALLHLEILRAVGGIYQCQIRDGVHYFEASGEPFDEVYDRITDRIDNSKFSYLMRC